MPFETMGARFIAASDKRNGFGRTAGAGWRNLRRQVGDTRDGIATVLLVFHDAEG